MSWAHIHLALNHVPVLGFVFLFLLLLIGVCRGSSELKRLSLQALALLSVISLGIKVTGDFAAEEMGKVQGIDKTFILKHEQTADQATTAIFLTGVVALIALFLGRKGKEIPRWALIATLIASLVTFGLLVRTANAGGQIRHPEIRGENSLKAKIELPAS